MRSVGGILASLAAFSGEVLAHPDARLHAHGIGFEHVLLFAVIVGLLAYAMKK